MALIKLKGSTEEYSFLIESKSIQAVSKSRSENLYKIDTGKPSNNDFFLTLSTPEEILIAVEGVKDSKLSIRKDLKHLDQENSELQYQIQELQSRLEDERKISKEIQRLKNIENIPDDEIEILEIIERCFSKLGDRHPDIKEKANEFKAMVTILKTALSLEK